MHSLVAFTGKAGAGKSTAAAYLVDQFWYKRLRFAGPLKAMIAALGLTEAEYDGSLKELPCERLMGVTPRKAMQTIGTEWGRACIHADLWTRLWQQDAMQVLRAGRKVVCDDCRFPNEAALIKALGGKIIKIVNPGTVAEATHESEAHDLPYDEVVLNAKVSLTGFYHQLNMIM